MEEYQTQKHVCRLCNKSFSSGKALGGHMRVHDALNPVGEEAKLNKCKLGVEVKENSANGLRENPRKSSKFTSLNCTAPPIEERVCGMCGREFMSLRGLHGHMRMHKKDLTVSKETRTSSRCNLFVESLSESEAVNLVRRRSNRLRSKMSSNSSLSSLNESSSVTETVDNVDKAGECLMMMSMGVHNWGELASGCKVKGNNSESFELKSSFQNKQIATDGNAIFDGIRPPERKKHRVEKSDPKLYEVPEIEKVIHDGRKCSSTTTVESSDQLMDDIDLNVTGLESMKLGKNSGRKKMVPHRRKCISPYSEIFDVSGRRGEYECNYCDKAFRTCQALGDHQTLHRKQKSIVAMEIDNYSGNRHGDCVTETYVNAKLAELKGTEDSMEEEIDGVILMNKGSVDSKVHNRPICFEEFASSQALGGHKRVHSAKNSVTSEERIDSSKEARPV